MVVPESALIRALVGCLCLLASCVRSDVPISGPTSPVSGTVLPGAAAPGTVNIETAPAMQVNVTLSSAATASDVLTLTVREELGNHRITVSHAGIQGGGVVVFDPIDVTSLDDGNLLFILALSNAAGTTIFPIPPVLKDTVPPSVPVSVAVLREPGSGSGSVPANTINLRNHVAARVEVEFGPDSTVADDLVLTFSDGATTRASSFAGLLGAGVFLTPPADLSPLLDGVLTIEGVVVDRANNRVPFQGDTAIKDTLLATPILTVLAAGDSNAAGVVNQASVGAAVLSALFPDASLDTDIARAIVFDGDQQIMTPVLNPLGGENALLFTDLDLSLLADGALGSILIVEDAAGNYAETAGSSALKDTELGSVTDARVLPGPGNEQDVINASSMGSVRVEVDLSDVRVGDQLLLRMSDGVTEFDVERTAPVGLATTSFGPFDAVSLLDGDVEALVEIHDAAGNRRAAAPLVLTKDTEFPTVPVAVEVPMGPNNPGGFVNAVSHANVTVRVQVGQGDDPDRSVRLRVIGAGMEISRNRAAPTAAEQLVFAGLDLTGFAEGALALQVVSLDGSGNVSSALVGSAMLDRSIVGPDDGLIPAGPDNDLNVISAAIAAAVRFELAFPVGSAAGDAVLVTLSDGVNTLDLPLEAAPEGGTSLIFGSVDTTSLDDGPIQLTGAVGDAAGNTLPIGPFPFTKDTTLPGAPLGAHVLAGADNDVDTINIGSQGAVSIEVELPATYDGAEQVRVRLVVPSGPEFLTPTLAAPAGGGVLLFSALNVTALGDGTLAMSVEVVDGSQNPATYAGVSPLKDTLPPPVPLSASIPADAANPEHTINASSQFDVSVAVDLPASYLGDELVSVLLDDGMGVPLLSLQQAAPPGGGSLTFAGLDASSLLDGPISVTIRLRDGVGNQVDSLASAAIKDVEAPAIDLASVLPTLTSALNTVSGFDVGSVTVELVWGGNVNGQETAQVRFEDGLNVVESAQFTTAQTSIGGFDLSVLLDGALDLIVTAMDAAGNESESVAARVQKRAQRVASRFAFVVSTDDDTLSSLQVDETENWLRLAEYEVTGDEPFAVAVDYASRFVHVANRGTHDLSSYRIDPITGALEPLGNTNVGMNPVALGMHPSGDFLFVASRGANEVAAFSINQTAGTLTQASVSPAGGAPTGLAVDPSGRFLFVTDTGGNEVLTYQIDPVSGALSAGVAVQLLNTPTGIDVDPSGRILYVGTSSSVTPHAIDSSSGALTPMTSVAAASGDVQLVVRPDGQYLYSVSVGNSRLTRFRIDAGALTQLSSIALVGRPSGIAVDPSGSLLYITSAQRSELQVFDLEQGNGAAALRQRQRTRVGAGALAIAGDVRGVLLSPRFLYAVDGSGESVASFAIDPQSGALSVSGLPAAVGAEPRGIAIHADAGLAFVANEGAGTVTRLQLDEQTGEPLALGDQPVGAGPHGAALDASRRYLYVSNGLDDSLSMFTLDLATGGLSPIAAPIATGTTPGWLAVDPTGQFVYVINRGDGTVGSFRIDPLSGALAPTAVPTVSSGGLDPQRLAVHPSGRFVSVTNGGSNTVGVFHIDHLTGNLSSIGQPTPTGLAPGPIAMDPTGRYALVGNRGSGDISVYEVSPVTGALFLVPGSPVPLGSALGSLSVDLTGQFLHASEPSANRITVFALSRSTGGLSQMSSQVGAGQPDDLGATGSTR
ncbi:MAG: 6-phosphogluconolactonase (cycloisomerase 2 family) [Chlamydiales bacterium]|jgi:6-phosphogluconolactonase (cycloisomerase 2 family)